ncbi:hypothetical protein [Streptomyces sp. NPDC046862]|uniref:hypothetical protein n=1 Tax=Streptomyces sp. NPDC046862 TaxID=3154603 RepID=UPI00345243AB
MPLRRNSHLRFDGSARQAMEFYKDVFAGTVRLNAFGEFGQMATPHAYKIMHIVLETPGVPLKGADTPPRRGRARALSPRLPRSSDVDHL